MSQSDRFELHIKKHMFNSISFSTPGVYVTPECSVIDVYAEDIICTSPTGAWDDSIKDGSTWDGGSNDYGLE